MNDRCASVGTHDFVPPEPSENMEIPQVCQECGVRRFEIRGDGCRIRVRYDYPGEGVSK